jgi:hypothetical protein
MMNPANLNANSIVFAVVLLLGIAMAVAMGDAVGSGGYTFIAIFFAACIGIPLLLKLGPNSWLLLVLGINFTDRSPLLPIPLHVAEILTMAAALGFALQVIMRRIRLKMQWTLLDYLATVCLFWLVVTFIKNPVGIAFLGSDMVGGRKYLSLIFAFIGYFILSRGRIPANLAFKMPLIVAVAWATPHALNAAAVVWPDLGSIISQFYSVQLSDQSLLTGQGDLGTEARIVGIEKMIFPFFIAMCSYYPPVTFINPLYPLRAFGFLASFILVGLSGFRSSLIAMVGCMTVAIWIRGRLIDFVPLAIAGVVLLIALIGAVQSGVAVPLTIQRTLSVLPLGWDANAVEDAQGTVEWRVDMWRDAWNDPNYFKDKIFGDGFGYTFQEMNLFADQMSGRGGLTGAARYELFMIRGSLHNGPLSSLRYGGFVGLILLTALMVGTAIYAVKIVRASSGTVYLPIALFTSIPLIYEIFAFYFIIGAYDNNMIQYFYGLGMLNLINRSLPTPVGTTSTSRQQTGPTPDATPSSGVHVTASLPS